MAFRISTFMRAYRFATGAGLVPALFVCLAGGAVAAERVVEMKAGRVMKDVDAYPKIVAPADDAEMKINSAVEKLDGRVKKAVADCKREGGKYADWTRTVETTMRGPRYLSFVVTDNSSCGGAHPNVGTTAIVYDLVTGAPVDWTKLLPAKLLGKVSLNGTSDGVKMITLSSRRLFDLYMAQYRAGERKDDKECTEAMEGMGGADREPTFTPWLDAKGGGLGINVDTPHVIQACADWMTIPLAVLRAEGVADATLKAIETAKK